MSIHYELTRFGFDYGAAKIERVASDETKGWILLSLETPKHSKGRGIQIYVTRTGKVRVSDNRGEWLPKKA